MGLFKEWQSPFGAKDSFGGHDFLSLVVCLNGFGLHGSVENVRDHRGHLSNELGHGKTSHLPCRKDACRFQRHHSEHAGHRVDPLIRFKSRIAPNFRADELAPFFDRRMGAGHDAGGVIAVLVGLNDFTLAAREIGKRRNFFVGHTDPFAMATAVMSFFMSLLFSGYLGRLASKALDLEACLRPTGTSESYARVFVQPLAPVKGNGTTVHTNSNVLPLSPNPNHEGEPERAMGQHASRQHAGV